MTAFAGIAFETDDFWHRWMKRADVIVIGGEKPSTHADEETFSVQPLHPGRQRSAQAADGLPTEATTASSTQPNPAETTTGDISSSAHGAPAWQPEV